MASIIHFVDSSRTLLFLLTGFVLAPKLGVIDISILFLIIASVYTKFKTNREFKFEFKYFGLATCWFVLFVISLITELYHGYVNDILLIKPIRQIIILFLLGYIFYSIKDKYRVAIFVIIVSAILNGLVVFTQYSLNAFGYSDDWLIMPGFDADINVVFRKPGLTAGYPIAGLLGVFGFIATVAMLLSVKSSGKSKLLNPTPITLYFFSMLIFFSTFITSRMALYMLFGVMLFTFTIFINSKVLMKFYFSFFLIGTLVIVLLFNFELVHHDTINVMLEVFLNFQESGELKSSSAESTFDSWLTLPQHISTLLVGNGLMNRSDEDTNLDAGYQIVFFGGGLIYFLIFQFLFYLYFFVSYRNTRVTAYKLFVALSFFLTVISEFKGGTMFARVVGDCLSLLFISGFTTQISASAHTIQGNLHYRLPPTLTSKL